MDDWHFFSYNLSKFLRAWDRNRAAQAQRQKSVLLDQISPLDLLADGPSLSWDEWQLRYSLEDLLMQLHHQAKVY